MMIRLSVLATMLLACSAMGQEASIEEGVVYAAYGDREVVLDVHSPTGEGPHPGILLVHGGGWTGGKRESFGSTAVMLAEAGYVVANIDYRLATEAQFPGCISDAKAAVRWMRANAEELGVDPERIYGIGGSAGGHIVAMVATTPGQYEGEGGWAEFSSELQGAVIMGTGVDQLRRVRETKSGRVENCVIFFGGELEGNEEVYAAGSPITHLSEATPPLLMMDGEFDSPGKRYPEFRERLDELDVRNEFVMIPGAKHGQWGRGPWQTPFVAAMLEFLGSL